MGDVVNNKKIKRHQIGVVRIFKCIKRQIEGFIYFLGNKLRVFEVIE